MEEYHASQKPKDEAKFKVDKNDLIIGLKRSNYQAISLCQQWERRVTCKYMFRGQVYDEKRDKDLKIIADGIQ